MTIRGTYSNSTKNLEVLHFAMASSGACVDTIESLRVERIYQYHKRVWRFLLFDCGLFAERQRRMKFDPHTEVWTSAHLISST